MSNFVTRLKLKQLADKHLKSALRIKGEYDTLKMLNMHGLKWEKHTDRMIVLIDNLYILNDLYGTISDDSINDDEKLKQIEALDCLLDDGILI